MMPYEELPESIEDFAKLNVCFDRLLNDTPVSCPVPLHSIIEYLALEVPIEELPLEALQFIRTAQVQEKQYWVWRLDDEYVDDDHLVTVLHEPDGTTCIGYWDNSAGLSPDQLLLADYFDVF